MLAASLIFYSWGEPKYVILMLLSITINYTLARAIHRYRRQPKTKKLLLILTIIVNIGTLFIFKYLDFFIGNLNRVFHLDLPFANLMLPIGISFYTFQILSYVVDVYRGKVKVQNNIFTLGTYIALFPQLIAGPIVRYSSIEKQLKRRQVNFTLFCQGFRRFIVGFAKKVLIANNVAIIADTIFTDASMSQYGIFITLVGLLAYTLQIYYDFSGYSDMAIGLGKIFGFDFDENFNYPYSATSITDFWKRWHISLTTWFKDYVYIPLGGNRCSKPKWLRNFLIVWLLTGLWHGASWNFILWGIFYAVVLLFEKLWFHKILSRLPKIFTWLYTFAVVNFGWLLFRVENLHDLKAFLASFKHLHLSAIPDFLAANLPLVHYWPFVLFGLVFMFPIGKAIFARARKSPALSLALDFVLIALFVISIFSLINNSYNPFIYFRF